MQILDGKDHRRGRYERVALDIIVEILNTGRHWGWLDHTSIAGTYTPEKVGRAQSLFLRTFRGLVDQWIDSGIREDGTDIPSQRDIRSLPKGCSESLFDILYTWVSRNTPRPALMNDGRIDILDMRPSLHSLELEAYSRESAIFHLQELLECPNPHRLARCSNPNCRIYFARKREHKGLIKRGTYCGKCQIIGGAERTRLSRQYRKNQQISAAALAWPKWTRTNRNPRRAEWVAKQVNRQFRNWPSIKGKWVTQNMSEILRRTGDS